MATNGPSLVERLSGGALSNTASGRQARLKTTNRASPYGPSPRSSLEPRKESSKEDKSAIDNKWEHDKFAAHNGIAGGILGAKIAGAVGRQTTSATGAGEHKIASRAFADLLRPKPQEKKVVVLASTSSTGNSGLAIKGSSNTGTSVTVEGLAPGTTADDVAEIFSRCGPILERRLLSKPSDTSAKVLIKFDALESAQASVDLFNNQPADGRVLKVVITQNTLGARLGKKTKGDLLPDAGTTGGMRSDILAKPETSKAAANQKVPTGPRRGGHGGRGGRGTGAARGKGGKTAGSLAERMELD